MRNPQLPGQPCKTHIPPHTHNTHTGSRLRTRAGPTQHRPEIGHDDLDAKDVQQLAQENRRRNLHGSLPGGGM